MHVDPDPLLVLERQDAFAEGKGAPATRLVVFIRIDALEEGLVGLITLSVGVAILDELLDGLQLLHSGPPAFVCILHEVG